MGRKSSEGIRNVNGPLCKACCEKVDVSLYEDQSWAYF